MSNRVLLKLQFQKNSHEETVPFFGELSALPVL